MSYVFIILLIAACSGGQKPTAPAGKASVAQSQSRLEPDPSEVEFYADDPGWKTFTVRTDLDSVLVRANPSGSDPAIELAGGQDPPTRDYCPAEGNDSPSRGRRNGWSLHVKACQVGQTEILLIDYDTREVLQRYEVNVEQTRQSQSRLEPDPSEVEFYADDPGWKTFTVRTDLDSVLVRANPSDSDLAIEVAGGQDPPTPTRDYCPAEGDDSPSRGRRNGWSLHVKTCQVGRTEILLIDYDTREVLQRYEINVEEYPTQTRLASGREPRWSPDGQRIVFYSWLNGSSDIYSMDPDGSNQTQLTTHELGDWSPTWSPDGLRIAFVSQRDGYDSIHIMDSDGKNKHRLTSNNRHDEYPRWSPDGRRIAYVSVRRENDENREIYVMDADGRNKERLTRHVENDWLPAWSPDGQRIAFLSRRNLDIEIYVMDADGRNKKRITQDNKSFDPAWSPDGTSIAYSSLHSVDDGLYEIYVMDADGRNKKRLTWARGYDFRPAWSPDGRRIAFVSEREGGYEIYVMDADGRNQERLTYGDGNDAGMPTDLAWSLDCQRILFELQRTPLGEEIYIVDIP